MKKILLTMLGAALIALPASAQIGVMAPKVDVNRLRSAIAKSDAEIADAKKAAKSATWIKRGTAFLDADGKPVGGLYASMPEALLKATYGNAAPEVQTINDSEYTVYVYEHFKAYINNGMVEFFVPVTVVDPAALDKAYDAFAKAYEMDAKTASKVKDGMSSIRTKSFENGGTLYALGDYVDASQQFRRAFRASSHPTVGAIDTMALYYAGMAAAYGEEYEVSLADLDKALELGYEAEGEIYRLKFVDLYNLDRKEESLETLKAGISRFPTNENLIDMMMRYYAENEGDPTSLIPLVESAIEQNPTNPSLWQGLARVYDKLGQIDNAIEAVKKAVELEPEDFHSNYLEGLFVIKKGDEMNIELGKQNFTSSAQYQQALAEVNDVFRLAMAPLEKAYTINPEELATVELLKNLSFRLREDEGVAEKYEKYNDLFNSMNVQ